MRVVMGVVAAILVGCNDGETDTTVDDTPPVEGDADTDADADTDVEDTDTDPTDTDPDDTDTDTDVTDTDDTDTDVVDTDDTDDTEDTDDADTDLPPPVDSDGDGLTDDEELILGTDPYDVDTDDDLLQDGAEAGLNTNPLDDDTDDDLLLDGEEVLTWNTAPDDADSDDDLLDDGTEVLVELTDPNDADTDDDLLDDGTEVLVETTDPLNVDTDGGGTDDGQEVLVDFTDPLDPADDIVAVCNYPNVTVDNPAFVPAVPEFDPNWISIEWQFLTDDAGTHDFNFDVSGDGVIDPATEAFSAILIVNVFDPAGFFLCDVFMEATNITASDPLLYAEPLLEVFDVDVAGGDSTCPALDATWYGTDDLRDLLAAVPWAVGFGDQAAAYGTVLEDAVVAAGLDWTNDWAPFVYAGWVSFDRSVAELMSYGFAEEADCEQWVDDGLGGTVDLPVADPIPNGGRLADDFFLFPTQLVAGLECDRAEVDVGDPAWVPGGVFMEPALVNYEVDFTPAPEGGVADFWADLDGDGIDEEVSATVTANFVDINLNFLCSFQFDASGAVPIDPATWVPSTGALFQAWELTLGDGETTDCTIIDAAIYGTDDVRDLLSFSGFATGEVDAVGPAISATFGAAVAMAYRDFFYATYISMDGVTADEHNWALGFVLDDCLEADLGFIYPFDPIVVEGWPVFTDSVGVFVYPL